MARKPRPINYKGKGTLKAVGVQIEWTEETAREYARCSKDPEYFIRNYCKIVSLDKGIVTFDPYPYQLRCIKAMHNNRNVIGKLFRQAGKSTIVAAYFAWYVLFNEQKTAVIAANKLAISVEIFSRVQFIIENLPVWMQQGVVTWNVRSLSLENGSRCIASASSPSAIRGFAANILLCDEYAHLSAKLASEFSASVFPTLSSSKESKLIIISTPNGYNHYHKLWKESEQGKNDFVRVEGSWWENPDRDQEWADDQRAKLGSDVKFRQEVLCSFEGSSYTLIDGTKLASIVTLRPVFAKEGFEAFVAPEPGHSYVVTVDVSRGRHIDNSAFSVIDITEMPYRVCLTYKDSDISTLEFPHLIYNTARQYNEAYILIEINDLGEEVSNIVWYEYEYEKMYFTEGNELSQLRGYPGVRTTTKVKSLGCSVLKDLVEKDQLMLNSDSIIQELNVFVKKKKSYAAENEDINDDLCTTLWLFAWLSKQKVFQEITNNDLRAKLTQRKEAFINESMTPFGFFQSAASDHKKFVENYRIMPTHDDPYFLTDDQRELLRA